MKQERGLRTRHALIRSAAQEFERHGYAQAKLSDISASAGVSSGALHFHFENKAAVAQAVEQEAATTLRRTGRSMLRQDQPLQRLIDISHALADRILGDVIARAGFKLSLEAQGRTGLNLLQEWQGCVQQLLAEASDEGALAKTVSQQEMADSIVAATTGFEVLGRRNGEWLSQESLTGFWQLLLPGLATEEDLVPGGARRPRGTPQRRPESPAGEVTPGQGAQPDRRPFP